MNTAAKSSSQSSLLPDTAPSTTPLAELLRPQHIDDVVGQAHLLGEGQPLRIAFESGKPHSMILWGPPGVGKTTLARLTALAFDAHFIAISAVLGGIKEIRDAVAQAELWRTQSNKPTIVFVDEVHRFNKSQQDAFLPHVESGLFVFIGATTENPSFEVNSALLSRSRVYVLQALSANDLKLLFKRAATHIPDVQYDQAAQDQLTAWADGDARRFINALEVVADAARNQRIAQVTPAFLERALSQNLRRFDKGGEAFYDQISALHKSVRGSNPDGALYWFVRMLDGGADPLYLARRLIRMAVEDVGLADPRALQICTDATAAYERLGTPEGELALANAVVYLAICAKSNAVYNAYNAARSFIAKDGSHPVPLHLRNAPTKLMKELDYGKGYRYAHNEAHAYAAGEQYLPDGVNVQFYTPSNYGLEIKIAEKLNALRALDEQAHENNPLSTTKTTAIP